MPTLQRLLLIACLCGTLMAGFGMPTLHAQDNPTPDASGEQPMIFMPLIVGPSGAMVQAAAVQTVFEEPFANSSQFAVTSGAFFSDGGFDYFGLADGAGGGDFGGGAPPSGLRPYTGFSGGFLTGMDLDAEGGPASVVVEWTGIDIAGLGDLRFSGEFAETFESPGDIDVDDFLLVEVQFDGSGYQKVLQFSGADFSSTGGPFNGIFREDTNFDGTGDGTALNGAAQTFVKSIAGGGSTLDLRFTARVESGDEDFAVDTFRITGDDAVTPPPPVTGRSLPLTEGFDSCAPAPSGWQIVSVDADTGNTWFCSSSGSYAEANGFGDSAPADEWLITPALNLDAQENDTLSFRNYTRFTDAGVPYPQLSVLYSTDYTGDPTAATWTELTGITYSPVDSRQFVDSGLVDLSGISGDKVYFAFRYRSSGTTGGSAAAWRIDSVSFASVVPPLTVGQCSDPATPIHDIQGSGLTSTKIGEIVRVEAVVVGDFQNNGAEDSGDLRGFYLQEEDGDVDGDPATSEGIFVFAPSGSYPDVSIGDKLRLLGTVAEFTSSGGSSVTQLVDVSEPVDCGNDVTLPTPATVELPVGALSDLERYEGMSVVFPQQLVISEYFNFDRFGEIVLTTERQLQPTALYEPGSPEAAALDQANTLGRITLDDGRTVQNPDPALHPNGGEFALDNRFRGGDIVQGATGVLDESFGRYRIQPTAGATYIAANPRPEAAAIDVGGRIHVAAFNVLNYFTTLGERGADTPEEFARQRAKIFAALAGIDADVVGLIEIENNDVAVQDLVSGLNGVVGSGMYDYIETGVIGPDAIKVAFIYKPATVTPVGDYAVLDSDEFLDPRNLGEAKNRPALAQTFQENGRGGEFTAVINHLKSKGSPCGEGDDDPEQGSCNLTRTLAAQVLVDWLATDPTGSGDPDFLILGDLNAYDKEDPIDAIRQGADDTPGTDDDYTDLVFQFVGEEAYSYVFDGEIGYLDYALANQALLDEVTGATIWHINADEPDILDYDTTFKQDPQDALYEPDAYRSSDHDPVIVGLELACEDVTPPSFDTLSVTPDLLWPPNHKYRDVTTTVVVSDDFDPAPTVTLVSVMSNEPDDGTGDGDTPNDIVTVDDQTFKLRAERAGNGSGRVYTITYRAEDECGNVAEASVTVTVPLNQAGGKPNAGDAAVAGAAAAQEELEQQIFLPMIQR